MCGNDRLPFDDSDGLPPYGAIHVPIGALDCRLQAAVRASGHAAIRNVELFEGKASECLRNQIFSIPPAWIVPRHLAQESERFNHASCHYCAHNVSEAASETGRVLPCSYCPRSFHIRTECLQCAQADLPIEDDAEWKCPDCVKQNN
jgi:hypothetical protein